MDIKSRFLIKLFSGAFISMGISVLISMFSWGPEYVNSHGIDTLIQLGGSAVYGAIAMGGSIVYDIESLGILKSTAGHYVATFVAFLIANHTLKWFGSGLMLVIILIIMTFIYVVIWLVQYLLWRKEIREIN